MTVEPYDLATGRIRWRQLRVRVAALDAQPALWAEVLAGICDPRDPPFRDAWAIILGGHQPLLLQIATKWAVIPGLCAQDLVQDANQRSLESLPGFRPEDPTKTRVLLAQWFTVLLERVVIETLRLHRTTRERLAHGRDDGAEGAAAEPSRADFWAARRVAADPSMRRLLQEVATEFTEVEWAILVLNYVHEAGIEEIAVFLTAATERPWTAKGVHHLLTRLRVRAHQRFGRDGQKAATEVPRGR